MKILDVAPDSPLFGYVRPGYFIKSINGNNVIDSIDFRYKISDEKVKIDFLSDIGDEISFDFYDLTEDDLGLTFDDGKIKVCRNDCIFCFVRQQPAGMRKSLYIKDEDYRLSFTHGNFITLSNTDEEDLKRIVDQRLSPLYISVHTTDDTLRRCMFRNEKLSSILPQLKYLTENGIIIHTQVVLCPEVNDGKYLEKTIDELSEFYPAIQTLGVVPVGLTKYRKKLPQLRTYKEEEASEIITYIEKRQKEFSKSIKTRFLWCADEFYIQAKRKFPDYSSYEVMDQFENGIGMVSEFKNMFNKRKQFLKKIKSKKKVLFLTGYSADYFLNKDIMPYLQNKLLLNCTLKPVLNEFWGETVTVSGLLTGQDLLKEAKKNVKDFDAFVIPPNCINNDDLFLDNMSLSQFQAALGKEVYLGSYNLFETIKKVFV